MYWALPSRWLAEQRYLLSYVYRKSLNRSDLVILDAKQVDDRPVAIIELPHRVPFGFHGCWVNEKIGF